MSRRTSGGTDSDPINTHKKLTSRKQELQQSLQEVERLLAELEEQYSLNARWRRDEAELEL